MTPIRASDLLPAIRAIGMDRVARLSDDELAQAIEDALAANDWCEEDGEGYCGNHMAWIEYHVDNLGPKGKVLAPGTFDPEETGYAVCTGAYAYDAARAAKSERLARA